MATKYVKGKIYKLDPATLRSDPGQPRKFMDPVGLAEMAASIRRNGIIEPIVFRQDETRWTPSTAGSSPSPNPEWAETDKQDLAVVLGDISQTATRILRDLRGEETDEDDEGGGRNCLNLPVKR